MGNYFEEERKSLYERANKIADRYFNSKKVEGENAKVIVDEEFKRDFLKLVDKVSLSLMEEKDSFYGYFLFQVLREIRFDVNNSTAINFKNARYVINFNPLIFLRLTMKQMETSIKQEILHIVSMHIFRSKELRRQHYSKFAINIGMDLVVNKYLDNLPPYAITLDHINNKYNLELKPYEPLEYYVDKVQVAIDLLDEDDDEGEDVDSDKEGIQTDFKAEKNHDVWDENDIIDDDTLLEFTQKTLDNSIKGELPTYLDGMIKKLKNVKGELPWNILLKRLMGSIESNKKKTITRKNRRQPNRYDLRGQIRDHKANVIVALDTSGSISDEEFKQAIKEVLNIVKNYNHEITIVECDNTIRNLYKVKNINDIKSRNKIRGGTEFSPVIDYANKNKANLLIYFTDGKGEDRLRVIPTGYKILWIISGRGDKLSLKEPYGVVKKLSKVEVKEDNIDMSDIRVDGYSMMNNQASFL